MAIINRASTPKQLLPGLNAIFGTSYGSIDNQHTVLFDTENSDRSFEEEVMQSGFGTAGSKGEGEAVQYDTVAELWTSRYVHETIAMAFAITEEEEEDNLYDTMGKIRSAGMGRAMANAKQIKAANIFNNGFSTNAAFFGGDGVALFSTAHPTLAAGNQSNRYSADLSETALEQVVIDTQQMTDDRGILIGAGVKSLHIPPALMFVAKRILGGDMRVGTADNDINALKSLGYFTAGGYVNNRFTDPNAWFVRTDITNGTKHFVRVPLKISAKTTDFDTGNIRVKARERYSFGWSDWRQWRGSSGSS